MRLSIFCVRDDFPIFYVVFFLFSSVLSNPFSGRPVCLRQIRIDIESTLWCIIRLVLNLRKEIF